MYTCIHESHESKLQFVSRIEFILSKLSNFLFMYPGSAMFGTGHLSGCSTESSDVPSAVIYMRRQRPLELYRRHGGLFSSFVST